MTGSSTALEREVMERIAGDQDPWGPKGYGGGSRRVSQAIGRAKRKGFVVSSPTRKCGYALTPVGKEVLETR